MDSLAFQQKYGRLQRKFRKAQGEISALRAEIEKLKATPPIPPRPAPTEFDFPPKPDQGRVVKWHDESGVYLGFDSKPDQARLPYLKWHDDSGLYLDCHVPCNTPAVGVLPPPIPTGFALCAAWVENQSRHEKAEDTRVKQEDRNRLACVLSACGWTKDTADPVLLRAAKGLWWGTEEKGSADGDGTWRGKKRYVRVCMRSVLPAVYAHLVYCTVYCMNIITARFQSYDVKKRCTKKRRIATLQRLCTEGFHGKAHANMEKTWAITKRFKVARIAKASDMDSAFNPTAVGALRACEGDLRKGEMGLLCGASSMRRRQLRVHALAVSLGWSYSPPDLKGEGWSWGSEEEGAFTKGVNLYVKHVYCDVRHEEVTSEDPWLVCITGDAARVTARGTIITTCGAKECDRRLPSQLGA